MPAYTVNGEVLTRDAGSTYLVNESTGTLGSGQQYVMRAPAGGPGWMPIIYLHGFAVDETAVQSGWANTATNWLAAHGFTVISADAGGISTWGNTGFFTAMDEAVTFARTLGLDDATIGIIGVSMGGSNMLAWAAENLSDVQACVGVVPCCDLDDIVSNDRGGLAVYITGAHGGAPGWAAAQPNVDPTPRAAAGDLDGLHFQAWYGAGDTIVLPATVQTVLTDIGSTAVGIEVSGDHAGASDLIDPYRLASYFMANYPPASATRVMVVA